MSPHDQALIAFGRWCLAEHREDCGDVDGSEMQAKAIELGLLVYVPVTEPCSDSCWCAEYHGEFPCRCLRPAPSVLETT